MAEGLTVGVAQMTSDCRHEPNIATLERFAVEARNRGCALLCAPEAAGLMERDPVAAARIVGPAGTDPWQAACARIVAENGLWIHGGSSPVKAADGKFYNRSAIFDPAGRRVAEYDKIHLFDVDLDGAAPIRESDRYAPGAAGFLLGTPWGLWGLTICYDLRFPGLFRDYAQRGANLIFVPSAFAMQTGAAHWETLLRARAIENGVWIIAAAQAGRHADGRTTWGHSLVVDPWGRTVLDMGRQAPALAVVRLDLGEVARARAQVPSLMNGRNYTITNHDATDSHETKQLAGGPARAAQHGG